MENGGEISHAELTKGIERVEADGYDDDRNSETDVIIDDIEDQSPLDVPVLRRRVTTDKQDPPVETLVGRINSGRLVLQPEFQRFFVWSNAKASRLIESLLLDIPIPVVYVAEEGTGAHAVVDGQQRLTSVCAFVNGNFPDGSPFRLSSLQVMTELNGKAFKDLANEHQEAILNATFRLIVIKQDSDPDVRFEVFERLNVGAEKLNDQELRNCVYRGEYNRLLAALSETPALLKILGQNRPSVRMRDRQLILRFFAMWRSTHLKYKGPMKRFLNREMEAHRDLKEAERNEMRALFLKSIEMAYAVFGDQAFRRYRPAKTSGAPGVWEKNKLNVALWDTILYAFGYFEKAEIIPIADSVREEFIDLMTNDPTFDEYISSTTDNQDRVRYRGDVWLTRLRELVGRRNESRNFSRKFKEQLFDQDPTCRICDQRLHDVDDSEVDHIRHYWRGGQTIPENARLTHRYCNRARGGRD